METFLYFSAKFLAFITFKFVFRIKVEGRENIVKEGPCIIVANHISFLDAIVVGHSLPMPVNYFAKDNLLHIFIISRILAYLGAIPLERDKPSSTSLRAGIKALKKKRALVVFPEGTRSKTGKMLDPKPGIGFLHIKSGAPLIPVLIKGTNKAMPVGARFIRPSTTITVIYGPPIKTEETDYAAISQLAMDEIAKLEAL
ncbi:1-acyl-sn-glycerol-3-phosphate acyltransferase [bacterium]|nr:1-acyl-sn-glycerol-3-phosphate acyltransferase [bacterium]